MQLNHAAGESVQSARTARLAQFVNTIHRRIVDHKKDIQKRGKRQHVVPKEDFFVPAYEESLCFVSEGGLVPERHQGIYNFVVELWFYTPHTVEETMVMWLAGVIGDAVWIFAQKTLDHLKDYG
jgi:hypothetical protein